MKTIFLPDKSTPLVFVDLSFNVGSVQDPQGKSGVASLMLSMLLRGTKKYSAKEFHEKLDSLGGEIHLGKYMESLRITGEVVADNLNEFWDLLCEMVSSPAFPEEEFEKLKGQMLSHLQDEMSSDSDMASRRFQEYYLMGHPYGRITSGSISSLTKIQLKDLKKFYDDYISSSLAVFAATGNFSKKSMISLCKKLDSKLSNKKIKIPTLEQPNTISGRQLLLLDKSDRTQSVIQVGTQGISYKNKNYFPLMIANHVFGGGSFSAWLMKEIREKRGWSYGAYSSFRSAREPLYFNMYTTPSNKDTAGAVKLMIELFEKFVKKGISKSEFDFAKKSLVNQSAFQQDTLKKKLNNKVSIELMGLPKNFYDQFQRNLKKVTYKEVNKAISKHFSVEHLFVVILGTTSAWEQEVRSLERWKSVITKPFSEEPSSDAIGRN